jgi:hypothetical protein
MRYPHRETRLSFGVDMFSVDPPDSGMLVVGIHRVHAPAMNTMLTGVAVLAALTITTLYAAEKPTPGFNQKTPREDHDARHMIEKMHPTATMNKAKRIPIALGVWVGAALAATTFAADPLPSWNDTAPRRAIVAFVEKVAKEGSPHLVPAAERIAVFDNDGTLWAEQPMYFQAFFIFDRIKALAPQHPEWETKEPFASVLKGDVHSALAGGEHALLEMAMATHAGITTAEFEKIVTDWITTTNPKSAGSTATQTSPKANLRPAPKSSIMSSPSAARCARAIGN